MARIIVKERGFETRSFPVTAGKITAGRARKNTIVLRNRFVSGEHCEISYLNSECTITDLNSTNGVFVNGSKIASAKLEDNDKILVGAALLIYIADEKLIQPGVLIAQLEEGNPEEQELAAIFLGHFGTSAAMEPLMETLAQSADPKVKAACAEALGMVGDSRAAEALLSLFDTPDSLVRNSVIRAILRLADNSIVDGVSAYLKHENKAIRILAAYTLGRAQNTRATKPLLESLEDEAFEVREAVIKALGDLGDVEAVKALMEISSDPVRYPQVWVIDSLGKIRSDDSIPIIIKALKSSDLEACEAAINALARLRAREGVPALISTLDDPDPKLRKAAAASLEKLRRHFEMESQLADSPSGSRETIQLSAVGDGEGDSTSSGNPKFGEDPDQWKKWWLEHNEGSDDKE